MVKPMSDKTLYQNFYKQWQDVTALAPQTVGPLTPVYKKFIPFFKTAPWKIIIPLTFALVCAGVLLHEITAAQIASLLQSGF